MFTRTFGLRAGARICAIAVALGLTMAVAPTAAQAAVSGYTPKGICGSGYNVLESHGLDGATVYLLYNGSYNCVVAIKTADVGTPTEILAGLQVAGSNWVIDTGSFRYYAGPVKQYGKGLCVKYGGAYGDSVYTSDWVHCG